MTFPAFETSRAEGQPNNLYRFTVGDQVMAYTDTEDSVVFNSVTYQPIPIDRDGVSSSGSLDKVDVKIRVPHDTEVAELFRVYPPSEIVGVTIFQGHSDDPDGEFLAVFAGRVISCAREDTTAVLTCQPVSTSMKRPGLRRNFMYGCPHALYGDQCRAIRDNFSWFRDVIALPGGNQIQLAADWDDVPGRDGSRFINGLVEWSLAGRTYLRTILRAGAGNPIITIGGSTEGLAAGSSIKMSLGCNHRLLADGDCQTVFGNAVNYGGQPWIPSENPVGYVNRFY